MINQAKRKFIKGAAYSSALLVGGLSTMALAKLNTNPLKTSTLSANEIKLLSAKISDSKTLSFFNDTEKPIVLDGIDKLTLADNNSVLVVRVNKSGKSVGLNSVTLSPDESMEALVVAASSIQYQGKTLSSDHPAINGDVPVTILNSRAA